MRPHRAVDFVERVGDVDHAQHRLFGRWFVATRRSARGFVADDFHVAQQLLPVGGLEEPPLLVVRQLGQGLAAFVAQRALLGLFVDRLADFTRVVRVRDDAVLAQHPHPLDALLLADVLDDLVDDLGLVQKHRGTCAAGDDLRQLRHVGDEGPELFLALLLNQQRDEEQHDRDQHDAQIEADFELEASSEHGAASERIPSAEAIVVSEIQIRVDRRQPGLPRRTDR
jgi:hypothetical protein